MIAGTPDVITVTVERPGTRDTFGKETPGYDFEIEGCLLAPGMGTGQSSSNEDTLLAHTVVTGAVLYLPPASDLVATDRVRARGHLWEVQGDVGDWGSAGMQAALRRSRG